MNIEGTYETNNGTMMIENHGEHLIGKYAVGGILKGTLTKNVLEGEWENNGQQGLLQFEFAEDGTFNGKYKKGLEPGPMRGKWTGKLISAIILRNETHSLIKVIDQKDELSEEKNETPKPQVQDVEKEKKKKSDPSYLAQLYQKEDYAFLCDCVDTSNSYSPNMIEKILDASLQTGNEEIEKYCYDQWKLKGDNISKMNEYNKWTNVCKIIKEKSIDEKYRFKANKEPISNEKVNSKLKFGGEDSNKGEKEKSIDEKYSSEVNRESIRKEKVNNEVKYKGGDTYKGEIENGRKNGKGIYYFANGDFYDGLWKDDIFISGIVQRTNSKGWVYKGEYLNYQRHGMGKLYNPKGELIDDGRFIHDSFEGDLTKNEAAVKELVKKFAKTHGYSSMLGKLFSGNSIKDLEEFKANIKNIYSKGDYKKVIKECVGFIEQEENLSKTEPALYYLLLVGEKLHSDQNSFWDLTNDVYNKHNSKRVNSFFVKSFLRDAFKQIDNYIVLKTDKGDEYYTEKLLYKGYTFPLGIDYKPLLETYLRLFEKTREQVSYQDNELEEKIKLCETRTKNTLAEITRWEEFAARNRAENKDKKESSFRSTSTDLPSSKKSEQKKDTEQGGKFEITYEIKLKEDAGFGNSFKAKMEAAKQGQSFAKIMQIADGKGGFREKSIIVNHDKNTLTNGDAKNYIVKNDRDVQIGVAGSSTIKIVKIKML